jgi:ABC-type bacteriocin/lantibiotic exporter with double-glycine peptidase domain
MTVGSPTAMGDRSPIQPPAARPAIRLENIRTTYGAGEPAVPAIAHGDLTVRRGEYVAIMGAAGSGKSTLLNIVGCHPFNR